MCAHAHVQALSKADAEHQRNVWCLAKQRQLARGEEPRLAPADYLQAFLGSSGDAARRFRATEGLLRWDALRCDLHCLASWLDGNCNLRGACCGDKVLASHLNCFYLSFNI
jgi:hypothetical protein